MSQMAGAGVVKFDDPRREWPGEHPDEGRGIVGGMAKIWFITGTSKGFGRIWAEAALQRGDKVVATARDVKSLEGLPGEVLKLALDVTDEAAVEKAVLRGRDHF